jgi:ATP-dependent Clp protease ATP-binding subunit ClpA
MFERFTESAIKVIMFAQEESRRLGHSFVGTEQILLALIREGNGVAAKVLKSLGVKLKDTRIEVEKIIGRGSGFVGVEIPFTPRAKRVLEFSLEAARHRGDSYICTEHLLLGLLREGEGVACRVLENLGVNLADVHAQVLELMGESPSEEIVGDFLNDDLTGLVNEIDSLIDRLNAALREASLTNRYIKRSIHERVLSNISILDLLAQLPDSSDSEQPGIKELLIQFHTLVEANTNLQPVHKAEMLEQVKILAESGQNL